jgi:hypothetical protein
MSKLQKIALLNLSLTIIGLFLQLLVLLISDLPIKLIASVITLILCCILVVSYFYRRKLAGQGTSQYDERDKSIHKTATTAGFGTMFLIFFSTVFITFLTVGPGGSVAIGHLLTIFLLSAMGFFFTESITVLVQYARGAKGEKS